MAERTGEGSPSGNPYWRSAGPSIPVVAAVAPESVANRSADSRAIGWSPTEWRARAHVGGRR